jgi:ribosomal protein S18 acetylase RimI-like enzyme
VSQIVVRNATADDVDAMGRVHVRAWQAAYRGAMPDEYLDGLDPVDRAQMWRTGVQQRPDNLPLVATVDGRVVGHAACGPTDQPVGAGELYSINVDPDVWGSGAGRALLAAAERRFAVEHELAVLWVVPANDRARRFYERAGWSVDGAERTAEVLGVSVPEVRYRKTLRPGDRWRSAPWSASSA